MENKTRHQAIIDSIEGAQQGHFKKNLAKALGDIIEWEDLEGFHFVPDAYRLEPLEAGLKVTVYEVEVTHHLTKGKLETYAGFWFWCEAYGIDFELIRVDAYGSQSVIDPCAIYYSIITKRFEASHAGA